MSSRKKWSNSNKLIMKEKKMKKVGIIGIRNIRRNSIDRNREEIININNISNNRKNKWNNKGLSLRDNNFSCNNNSSSSSKLGLILIVSQPCLNKNLFIRKRGFKSKKARRKEVLRKPRFFIHLIRLNRFLVN